MTPQVILIHSETEPANARPATPGDSRPHVQVIEVSSLPGPPQLRREAAATLAAGLAHRGATVVVHGDLGSAVERSALHLRLRHQGLRVVLLDEGGYEPFADSDADAATGDSSRTLTTLITRVIERAAAHPQYGPATESPNRYAVLLRHGRAHYQTKGFPSANDLTLSLEGQGQAFLAGSALRAYAPTVIYCSTLRRAQQTAAIVAENFPGVDVIYDERLNEREFTPLYGLTDSEIARQFGEEFLRTFTTDPDKVELAGVQSLPECQERVVAFFRELADSPVERPLVVAHGGPFAWLASHIMRLPLSASRRWRMRYGAMSTIALASSLHLVSWNSSSPAPEAVAGPPHP